MSAVDAGSDVVLGSDGELVMSMETWEELSKLNRAVATVTRAVADLNKELARVRALVERWAQDVRDLDAEIAEMKKGESHGETN